MASNKNSFGNPKSDAPIFHPGERGFVANTRKGVHSVVGSCFAAAPIPGGVDEGYARIGKSRKTKGGQ
jgi:hypothetical protein